MHISVEKTKQLRIEITGFFSFHTIASFKCSAISNNAADQFVKDEEARKKTPGTFFSSSLFSASVPNLC